MESLAGTRLGRFRITRLIGKGGMGEVYAAVDEDLDRQVAIKVLGSAVDVEPHRRRFLREARLAARLNHPNIASIHEVGDSDGRRYIVMELLEGKTLRVLLNQRRLATEEALSIARDVARALARAHAGEVIHRDIKPENIFITTPAPDVLLAKVLDFGLARDELMRKKNDEENTATDLTGPGEACGTAGYLAPEQARGLVVDVRADIFSFGAVFYEMLTGKRAFDGRNQLAKMLAVVKHPHDPLRLRAPDVSPEIEAVVERCLAKAPADRYADGSALLAELEQIVRSSRMSSPDLSSSQRLELKSDIDPTGPKLPAPSSSSSSSSSSSMIAAQRDGSSGSARSVSNETPAPSTKSQRVRARRRSLVQQHWPLLAAAGGGLLVALLVIALAPSSSRGSRSRPAATAAAPRSPVISAAREIEGEGAVLQVSQVVDEPPGADEEADQEPSSPKATKAAPSGAPAPRATARTDKRTSASFTRLPNDAPTASTVESPVATAPSAPASPAPASPAPAAAPVEAPKTGTIRFQNVEVLTIVVDGEHHRLRNDTITLACGRHRVRVGLNNERFVDVPCGGTVLF